MPALTISRCDQRRFTELSVRGEIDICTAPELVASLDEVPLADLVLDLSAVSFFGAVGLHILASTHDRLHDAGHRFVVVESPQVGLIIRVGGLMTPLRTVRARLDQRSVDDLRVGLRS